MKPEKRRQLGKVMCYTGDLYSDLEQERVIYTLKSYLDDYYKHQKQKHEHNGERSWCKFEDYEYVIKSPISYDPYDQHMTVGIKWFAFGRSFYIDRTFRMRTSHKKMHLNKKHVPKRKRGKPILK